MAVSKWRLKIEISNIEQCYKNFLGNQQQEKGKDREIDKIGGILQTANVGNKCYQLEGIPKKRGMDCSKGDEGTSTSLQALLQAVKG